NNPSENPAISARITRNSLRERAAGANFEPNLSRGRDCATYAVMRRLRSRLTRQSVPEGDAPALVSAILANAEARRASDVHFEPTGDGYEVRYRVDGLLETGERYDATVGRSLVARLMVMG